MQKSTQFVVALLLSQCSVSQALNLHTLAGSAESTFLNSQSNSGANWNETPEFVRFKDGDCIDTYVTPHTIGKQPMPECPDDETRNDVPANIPKTSDYKQVLKKDVINRDSSEVRSTNHLVNEEANNMDAEATQELVTNVNNSRIDAQVEVVREAGPVVDPEDVEEGGEESEASEKASSIERVPQENNDLQLWAAPQSVAQVHDYDVEGYVEPTQKSSPPSCNVKGKCIHGAYPNELAQSASHDYAGFANTTPKVPTQPESTSTKGHNCDPSLCPKDKTCCQDKPTSLSQKNGDTEDVNKADKKVENKVDKVEKKADKDDKKGEKAPEDEDKAEKQEKKKTETKAKPTPHCCQPRPDGSVDNCQEEKARGIPYCAAEEIINRNPMKDDKKKEEGAKETEDGDKKETKSKGKAEEKTEQNTGEKSQKKTEAKSESKTEKETTESKDDKKATSKKEKATKLAQIQGDDGDPRKLKHRMCNVGQRCPSTRGPCCEVTDENQTVPKSENQKQDEKFANEK